MKKFLLGFLAGIIFTIVALIATYFILATKYMNEAKYQPQENLSAPIEIPAEGVVDFQEITDTSKPIVALFYVDWCGYCRRFMPIFGEYAKKYGKDFTFATINCDIPENKEITHQNNINSFPTLKIIDKQIDYVLPIDITATRDEKVFDSEVKKHLKLRAKFAS